MNQVFIPIVLALGIGFSHAFEADHLIAMSNLVANRNRSSSAMKDGIFWGLGHTSTIFLIGAITILGKWVIADNWFEYFEGLVGCALIVLGGSRLIQLLNNSKGSGPHHHSLAFGIGLIHGLAGSSAVVLLATIKMEGAFFSMIYLVAFGLGSMSGMLLASSLCSVPLSKQFVSNTLFQKFASALTGVLCLGYGIFLIADITRNIFN